MKPFLIGVTGHIGGGKSTLLNYIASHGFCIIDGDKVAKKLLYTKENKDILVGCLGSTIIDQYGEYDFKEIRRIFFSTPQARLFIESFTSNDIWKNIERTAEESGQLFVFVENAVLFEQGWGKYFNLVICIYCEQEEAIRRVTESKKLSYDEVTNIFSCQMPIERKIGLSDVSVDTTHLKQSDGEIVLQLILSQLDQKYSPKSK